MNKVCWDAWIVRYFRMGQRFLIVKLTKKKLFLNKKRDRGVSGLEVPKKSVTNYSNAVFSDLKKSFFFCAHFKKVNPKDFKFFFLN